MPCARCVTRGQECTYSHALTQNIPTATSSWAVRSRQQPYDKPPENQAGSPTLDLHGFYEEEPLAGAHAVYDFDFPADHSFVAGYFSVDASDSYIGQNMPQDPIHLASTSDTSYLTGNPFGASPNIPSLEHHTADLSTYREHAHLRYLVYGVFKRLIGRNFYSAMRRDFPAIHLPTFHADHQPELVNHAIYVSGAYLSDTPAAKQFVRVNGASTIAALLEVCEPPPYSVPPHRQ